jgi:hypothetical protein
MPPTTPDDLIGATLRREPTARFAGTNAEAIATFLGDCGMDTLRTPRVSINVEKILASVGRKIMNTVEKTYRSSIRSPAGAL